MQDIIKLDLEGVNCYLIKQNANYILIDTGGHMFMDKKYDNRLNLLLKKLKNHKVSKDNLKLIILTHGDCDHSYNAAYLRKEFDAPIAMSSEDIYMVSNPTKDCYRINSKYSSFAYKFIFKMMDKKINHLMIKIYNDFNNFTPDLILKEGMTLAKFGFDGTIYNTPGHTPGSICILTENNHLICGDLFCNNSKPSLAINAFDFNLLKNQAKRMLTLPVKNIYPGHGKSFSKSQIKLK